MQIIASEAIQEKISKIHGIDFLEVEEAFNNFSGYPLEDKRAQHKTKPPTLWCLSETYDDRLLKLVFIIYEDKELAVLRTAYEPDDYEVDIWNENQ